MREHRKCPFCGEKMICVNTQDGEFTCTSCAEYANHDVLDFIDNLKAEKDKLKKEVANYHQLQWQHDALIDENVTLSKENARLKCLALHAMSEYCFAQGTIIHTKLELTEQPIEEDRKMIHKINIRDRWGEYFAEDYRKAKAELREGK